MATTITTVTYPNKPAWHLGSLSNMRTCERCGVKYEWSKSHSSLKMTYCGILCEIGGLGFSLESLIS